MTLRILTVCTGNICRSLVAERALAHELGARGVDVEVRSAGTYGGLANDADTLRAAREAGLDTAGHVSRRLTTDLMGADGADLIVALTREHLREIVALDQAAWPRTFTLRELARRAVAVGPVGDDLGAWRQAVLGDRKAAGLMQPDPADDVRDPHGGPYRGHQQMVVEVTELARTIAAAMYPA